MRLEWILGFLVFFPFAAAPVSYCAGAWCLKRNGKDQEKQETLRDVIAVLSAVCEFLLMLYLALKAAGAVSAGESIRLVLPDICGWELSFVLDGFRLLYGLTASFMWMMASMLSVEYMMHHRNRSRYYLFLLVTLGATMGVFFSSNLYTTFVFFEIMSFTSYVWVAQEETGAALRAAGTYLAVAVIGGLAMLMGILLLNRMLGVLEISELSRAAAAYENKGLLYAAGGCMLVGFGAKAGAFPLHIWLPKAHPVAPAPASALLSGILTKTGIYGTLILSCSLFLHDRYWSVPVLGIGVATMLGGAVLGVFSIDLKRVLACSSMSQIGFILVGIGMQGMLGEENALAVHGTFLHMVNHSLIKLVLFLAAGVIYMNAHSLDLNEIRGFGRKKPLLACIFLTGALAISGVPFFGGYVSKTLLHESILEYGSTPWMKLTEWLFLLSGGLTAAYMTKLFAAIFVEKNEDKARQEKYDRKVPYMNIITKTALAGSALVLFVWGVLPSLTMDPAAVLAQRFMGLEDEGAAVSYFSLENLKGAAISLGIGAIVYIFFVRKCLMKRREGASAKAYVNAWPRWLDLEELIYRPVLIKIFPAIFGVLCRILDGFVDTAVVLLRKTLYRDSPLPYERPEGNALTVLIGRLLNGIQAVGNITWRRQRQSHRDYKHLTAMKMEEFKESGLVIQRSLSFGLLLFCVGLSLTLVYLILW